MLFNSRLDAAKWGASTALGVEDLQHRAGELRSTRESCLEELLLARMRQVSLRNRQQARPGVSRGGGGDIRKKVGSVVFLFLESGRKGSRLICSQE